MGGRAICWTCQVPQSHATKDPGGTKMTDPSPDEENFGPCSCCGEPGCIKDHRGLVVCVLCAVISTTSNDIECRPENRWCPKNAKRQKTDLSHETCVVPGVTGDPSVWMCPFCGQRWSATGEVWTKVGERGRCCSSHPDQDVLCDRILGHDGDHEGLGYGWRKRQDD